MACDLDTGIDIGALARRIRDRARGVRPVVLVDGRSGTGKTTLADALAPALAAQTVHLDDLYPGWDGLRAGSDAVVRDVLAAPDATTGRPGWRRWDWGTGLQTEWRHVDPASPLLVEGCGSLSRASARLATYRLWLELDDDVRRIRALDRDGEVFAREWDRWSAQEDAFIAAEDPVALADEVLRLD
jgi:hypothetical protein